MEPDSDTSQQRPRVQPEELTEAFLNLGLSEGAGVVLHMSLAGVGEVVGGAGMVIHRLLDILGRKGTLLMPTFTSVTRHASTHNLFTKAGCWCEGKEGRHLPFIPELQPDKELGEIAHRLCSWPMSRRSGHPAYSFVAVGSGTDELVRKYSLQDPLQPLKVFLKHEPFVMTIGTSLDSVTVVHLAVERHVPSKFNKERALGVGSPGLVWTDVVSLGCNLGFPKIVAQLSPKVLRETQLRSARATLYPMKALVEIADQMLAKDSTSLNCGRAECLSCKTDQK